ncbi:O-methyltransferase [Neofamilia massiliensis]|uniref:O-methyltransferase n=1 Tax=Neofamilia massiliensis TaxID=1673724 RepID=UPI0006BB7376|nr:O-methyltransferase [Neofamilia massiliensis]
MNELNYDYVENFLYENIKRKSDFLESLEKEALENHVPIISPDVGQFLKFLIASKKPKKILEIGTAVGYSGLLMLSGSEQIEKFVTIELNETTANIAKENFKKAGEDSRVQVIIGDGLEQIKKLDEDFDLVFIDAAKAHYQEYFNEIKRLIKPGSLIVCDNVLYKAMVTTDDLLVRRKKTIVKRLRAFIDEVINLEDFESSLIPMGDGLLVAVRIK